MSRTPPCSSLFLIVFITLIASCGGPIGPLSGGALSGESAPAPSDWGFARDVETAQLETRPQDPYSVNIWIGVLDGALYVPTSLILGDERPTERAWVQHVEADPEVRIRIDGKIYAGQARRVQNPDIVSAVKALMLAKYEEEATPHSDGAWVYEITAR